MYTGKNKTALSSMDKITNALKALLQTQSYSSITISTLCDKAGLSRQTFYSLFDNKEDAICYFMGTTHGIFCEMVTNSCNTLMDICNYYAQFLLDNQSTLKILFLENNLGYLFHRSLRKTILNDPQAGGALRKAIDKEGKYDQELLATYWASCCTGFAATTYRYWKDDFTRDYLAKRFYFLFSGEYVDRRFGQQTPTGLYGDD